jgi:glutathione synthase/RimK-type ligase-like ATP-grasp enzyme
MIGIAGTRADPVLLHFATRCVVAGAPFADIDLVEAADRGDWDISLPSGTADRITGAEEVRLADLTGLYVRPIFLGTTARQRTRWTGLLEGLTAWMDETDVTVVNRPGGHQLNTYKPAHYAWLAANGFRVPPSLLSTDPVRVKTFMADGRTVVKPVSGVRATTQEITAYDLDRLASSDSPVLVQRLIEGADVRAHVIGDAVFAARFRSDAIDYRKDRAAEREMIRLPDDLADLLVRRTADQGLLFAGWDFKVDSDGTYWCLECNPMPGYSHYDRVCDYTISDALMALLRQR